ncbi:hypothetical protein ANCDUO_11917 [Ancylostoma duodenale]|uniref:Uncharacterized protein n=1 Tax=Ancylostoma duodenale TaxID=51022 RepID=A0A0C2GGF4_9BILA|nr:hypothetical protein ANCDUO_11917 [Ancylostoma duodenale]
MLSVPRVALRRGTIAVEVASRAAIYRAQQVRCISAKDVFNYTAQTAPDIPAMPLPPPPARSIEEMVEAGESVLGELGLLSWWKPSSYFRMALEGIHMHADIPWWATIVCANKSIPPTFAQLKEQDLQQFKKAGRGKPINN